MQSTKYFPRVLVTSVMPSGSEPKKNKNKVLIIKERPFGGISNDLFQASKNYTHTVVIKNAQKLKGRFSQKEINQINQLNFLILNKNTVKIQGREAQHGSGRWLCLFSGL